MDYNNGKSSPANFPRTLISVNRLKNRKSPFQVQDWILDSGSFTALERYGKHLSVRQYAKIIDRFSTCGNLQAAVTQDYICKSKILNKLNLTVTQCQELTIHRYHQLQKLVERVYIMPVLQGIKPKDYVRHIILYEQRLSFEAWVGVGNLNSRDNQTIAAILLAIKEIRPDFQLHGFGIKKKNLKNELIRQLLYSADSAVGCFAKSNWRIQGTQTEAIAYGREAETIRGDLNLFDYEALVTTTDPELQARISYLFLETAWQEAFNNYSSENFYQPTFNPTFISPTNEVRQKSGANHNKMEK